MTDANAAASRPRSPIGRAPHARGELLGKIPRRLSHRVRTSRLFGRADGNGDARPCTALHHRPRRVGGAPVASITPAEIAHWVGGLVAGGTSPSTAGRYLATPRSILAYAVADGRVSVNAAESVRALTGGHVRREGQYLTRQELEGLAPACRGVYADVVKMLGLSGLRWGELAGLQVGDRVAVPGQGLRVQRSVLASSKGRAVHRHAEGQAGEAYLRLPVAGCRRRPKVVQRILGHASAAMTMELYAHIDQNLWDAAATFGGTTGAPKRHGAENDKAPGEELGL